MSRITPGQDSHVSPFHVLQNTTQSSSAVDECATFFGEAFENTRNVIYIPYWTDTRVLSV